MPTSQKALLHPIVDFLMIGGLSILFIGAVMLFNIQAQFTQDELVIGFLVLSFLVNLPHFASTYQLFYGDQRSRITTTWPWKLIGIGVPILMFLFMTVSYFVSWRDIGFLVSLMFILVGWHYAKQVFGCMVVTAQRQNYRFSDWQRWAVKINLLGLWMITLTENYRRTLVRTFNSLEYPFMLLPAKYEWLPYGIIILSALLFLGVTFARARKEGVRPPPITWIPLVALYFWVLPTMNRDLIFMSLPLFHALQYMLFIFTYKKNQFAGESSAIFFKKMTWFFLGAFLLGALFMEIIPRALDLFISLPTTNMTIFLVMFNVFINIHHYLMDFLLWRRNVPEFHKYLLDPRP